MLKRAAAIVLLALTASAATVSVARADFHARCDVPPKNVSVSFTAEGADLVFSGSIVCIGADSAAITVLRLTPVVPPGEPTEAPLDASASCGPCTADDAVHAEGRVLAEPGLYEIHMETEITGNGATQRPSRTVQFAYLGTGDPVRVG